VRAAVLAFLLALGGCRYLRDRGADLLDPFRASVGVGSVAGVRVRAVGVVDTGLMMGVKPRASALGWRYGTPLHFSAKDRTLDADQSEVIRSTSLTGLDLAAGSYRSARTSAALLPGIFTWTDATPTGYEWLVPEEGEDFRERHWVWSRETSRRNRYAQVHAFDVEVEVAALAYLELGLSPGEIADFFLGFVGVDLAKDDGGRGGGR
jgi:hypothetical protein